MIDKKIALVTGASRGIGRAVALQLAEQGYHVVALARTVGALESLDDEIKAAGGTCTLIPQDLLKLDELDNLGPALYEKFGQLDIFIGNAGMLGTLGPVPHADPKEFQKVMDVNLTANFRLIRTLDPLLKMSDAPQIVFLTTGHDVMEGKIAYWSAYAISKAALQTMARLYDAENQQNNLKIHIHDPKRVRTDMRAKAKPCEDPLSLPPPEEAATEIIKLLS